MFKCMKNMYTCYLNHWGQIVNYKDSMNEGFFTYEKMKL